MKGQDLFTYRDLLIHLHDLSDEELDQPVCCLPPNTGELEPIFHIGTVKELCHNPDAPQEVLAETKDVIDWKHKPEQVVLLRDWHPFDENGSLEGTWEGVE